VCRILHVTLPSGKNKHGRVIGIGIGGTARANMDGSIV